MKAEQFCFWLQGHFEMNPNAITLDASQTNLLKRHLELVFAHDIDPKMGSKEHQEKLNTIHDSNDHGVGGMVLRC